MREWVVDEGKQRVLLGHYYARYSQSVRIKSKGENHFCNSPKLFTIPGLPAGDDAIERIFFKSLDDAAATAHRMVLRGEQLNFRQRLDFVRLLLSLEARHPRMVDFVRQRGTVASLRMNSDPDIRKMLDEWGDPRPANVAWDELIGFSSADQAMETVQKLTTNERIGKALVEAPWGLLRAQEGCDRFVLADRPLIRIKGRLASDNVWVLPISPDVVWFCAMGQQAFRRIGTIPPRRFVHLVNSWGPLQSDKYVFSLEKPAPRWLVKRLKWRAADGLEIPPFETR